MAKKTKSSGWKNRIVGQDDVDPKRLKANPSNWREHPQHQRNVIAAVLGEVGWVDRVIVNKTTGRIVDGHARVELAIERGEGTVPVSYVTLTEEEEKKILATLDPIAGLAQSNNDMLAELLGDVESRDSSLQKMLADMAKGIDDGEDDDEEPDIDAQAAATYQKKWKTKSGQVWEIGNHRLMIGDSRAADSYKLLMGGQKAKMVYTDPPYGVSYQSRSGKFAVIKNDQLSGDALLKFLIDAFKPMVSNTAQNAAFYIWHASSTRREFGDAMRAVGLIELQYLLWVKPAAVMGWGDYRWAHEPCFYACREGQEPNFYGDRTNTTVWYATAKKTGGRLDRGGQRNSGQRRAGKRDLHLRQATEGKEGPENSHQPR